MNNSGKIILDLCGGTGAWSKPYKDAGYFVINVTLPTHDVQQYVEIMPNDVYGILAAPPCTMFSFARTNPKSPRNLYEGMKIVRACLQVIWQAQYNLGNKNARKTRLKFWALENPNGFLRFFLGKPALMFNPFDYGERYQKLTCLWGNFTPPKKTPIILRPEEKIKFTLNNHSLPKIKRAAPLFDLPGYAQGSQMTLRQARRSVTPAKFAQAFFEANQ